MNFTGAKMTEALLEPLKEIGILCSDLRGENCNSGANLKEGQYSLEEKFLDLKKVASFARLTINLSKNVSEGQWGKPN